MKPFSLEEYLANPDRKVVTRDGRDVRIICTDVKSRNFPVVGVVAVTKSVETAMQFTAEGRALTSRCNQQHDLFFATIKHEGWINIYRPGVLPVGTAVGIYPTEEEAKKHATDGCISTSKIEWEE